MVKDHSDSEKETHSRNYMGYFFQLAARAFSCIIEDTVMVVFIYVII